VIVDVIDCMRCAFDEEFQVSVYRYTLVPAGRQDRDGLFGIGIVEMSKARKGSSHNQPDSTLQPTTPIDYFHIIYCWGGV